MIIGVELRAEWELDHADYTEYEVKGMPNTRGISSSITFCGERTASRSLWWRRRRPRLIRRWASNRPSSMLIVLEKMHGQRPIIFYTNGFRTEMWDDKFYPPRTVAGFYRREEAERLIQRWPAG